MTRLRWLFALPALWIAIDPTSVMADVRDKAGLFSAEALKQAESEIDRIEKEYSVPIVIETIESLGGRKIDAVLPEHAKAADAKGLFILISKGDHLIQVETHKSFAKYLTPKRDLAIREIFTREFKANDINGGLAKGLDKIDSTLSEARSDAGGTLKPATPATRRGGQAQAAPGGRVAPGKPSDGGMNMWLTIGLGLLALFIVIRILGALFSGGNRGYGNQQMMGGRGGPMGGPGYGGGGGGGGGGGFMSSMFGGIGGALAGNWLYDQFSGGRHHDTTSGASNYDPAPGGGVEEPAGPDYVGPADGGGDWGGGGSGGDAGGGGDWGGGGGDVGGGGGGDWGGGGGGGDWGGGGGGDGGGSW